MPESYQHKLDRVRPPRVQITYDVETAGAIVMTELPFVVGIMADLGSAKAPLKPNMRYETASQNGGSSPAQPPQLLPEQEARPLPEFKDRKYVNIDRDNFNDIMKSIGPRLILTVPTQKVVPWVDPEEKDARKKNKYKSEDDASSKEAIELEFKNIKDFDPINVVKQVKLLHDLFEKRSLLSDLLTKLEGNEDLEMKLREILGDDEAEQRKLSAAAAATAAITDSAGADPAAAATAAADVTAKAAAEAAAKAAAEAEARDDAARKAQAAVEAAQEAATLAETKAAAARAAKVAAATTAKAAADATAKAAADAPKAAADEKAATDKAAADAKTAAEKNKGGGN